MAVQEQLFQGVEAPALMTISASPRRRRRVYVPGGATAEALKKAAKKRTPYRFGACSACGSTPCECEED